MGLMKSFFGAVAAMPVHPSSDSGFNSGLGAAFEASDATFRDFPARLALHHRPGELVLLDDVPDYLEVLADAMPRNWIVRTFGSGQECVNYLQQEPPKWEADFWEQQQLVEKWHGGQRLIPLILEYLANHQDRRRLTKVFVSDYLMPGMDGLAVMQELAAWPGYKVLLTGAYDENLAAEAIYSGQIHQFLPKQTPALGPKLRSMISSFMSRPNARYDEIWAATLKKDQIELLQSPDIAAGLNAMVSEAFVEWFVIGDPFGVLGVDRAGQVSWIQLEPTAQLPELADLAEQWGASRLESERIRMGNAISDCRLLGDLHVDRKPGAVPAVNVGSQGLLIAAARPMPCDSPV